MGSLPLVPLDLDVDDVDPPVSMPDIRASLSFPPDTFPVSPIGANRLSIVGVMPWCTGARPLSIFYGTFGGCGVPN